MSVVSLWMRRGPRFTLLEAGVTLFAVLCWRLLAFAMYAESYDLDESAPVQPTGGDDIAVLALLFGFSVPATWLLGLVPWAPWRTAVEAVVALRLGVVVLLSAVLFVGLLTGVRLPLVGWRI
ncbi:hypothetical protein ACFXP3_08460 [Streptomyces sp. NPDC059096]|uniref:hypothetical protein n=1 Tax=Streptomyces sp. NPDC059096 TaxID=3346727 RepID=UPI0036A588B5